MNYCAFRRIASSLMVLAVCAGAHYARAQSPATRAEAGASAVPSPGAAAAAVPAAPSSPAAAPEDLAQAADDAGWDREDDEHHRDRHPHRVRHGEHSDEIVNIGHDSDLPLGRHADSVVSILGSSSSEGEAGDVVSILGSSRITGPVSGDAVAVLGGIYIDSKMEGDAVAVLGNVDLGPNAEIGGDLIAVGGTIHRDPAAIVHGQIQNIFAGDFGNMGWLHTWIQHCLIYGRPLAVAPGLGWAWKLSFGFLALYVCLALVFREGLFRCVETFETQPGQSILAALITVLLTPVGVVLLCITVIGIAAVPFVVVGLFCAGLFGKAVMLAWIGRRVTGKPVSGPASHPAVAVLIGGALVLLLYLVPLLGFLVYKLLGLIGLGAVVYTLILAARARQAVRSGAHRAAAAGIAPQVVAETAAEPLAQPRSAPGPASPPQPQPQPQPELKTPPPASPPPPHSQQAQQPPPPPVTAALARAGFMRRMAALLIDVLLIGVLLGVLHHSSHLQLLVLAAYGAIMWKLRGTTVGGIVLDLQVVRLDGREIDWPTAIVRALGCFLSLAVAGLGFFWIAFDEEKQAWHDKIAGTVVVRVAKGAPLV